MAGLLAAAAILAGAPRAQASTRVTVALLPRGTTVAALARVDGLSPGLMSAGIGEVPAAQTHLDVSQGNRVASSLYDGRLAPALGWAGIVARAESAPAEVVPGLLATTLAAHGIPSRAGRGLGSAAAIATERDGSLRRGSRGPGLTVEATTVGALRAMVARLRGDDLLIAYVTPPPGADRALPIGVAGRGFHGELTSDSTRTGGYVVSTDVAPTILRRLGFAVPGEMSGEPMRARGSVEVPSIESRADRMAAIPARRAPVLIAALAAWLAVAAVVALLRPSARRLAVAWLSVSFAYLPLLLLAGAALAPSAVIEAIVASGGAAALSAVTVAIVRGWRPLATACAITVLGYAVDVIAGSGLTKLSLLGPDPIYGARFYGIGNELEALLAVMVPAAVGAALTAAGAGGRRTEVRGVVGGTAAGEAAGRTAAGEGGGISGSVAAGSFLLAGLLGAVVFGAGRFGADVGAAIVLPVGAVVAAVLLPPRERSAAFAPHRKSKAARRPWKGRRRWIAAAVTPVITVGLLVLIDLLTGANAHLTRTVLDTGGAGGLGDVVQRRLELSAHGLGQAAGNPLFWLVVAGIGLGIRQRRRVAAWLAPAPAARAGFFGACAAVVAGVLVNDSGATFLVLGSLALGAFAGFAWAQTRPAATAPSSGPSVERSDDRGGFTAGARR